LGLLLAADVLAAARHSPVWFLITLSSFCGAVILVVLIAYLYLMVKNPDALRSERFTLSKMALERSVTGDTLAGFREMGLDEQPLLTATEAVPDRELP